MYVNAWCCLYPHIWVIIAVIETPETWGSEQVCNLLIESSWITQHLLQVVQALLPYCAIHQQWWCSIFMTKSCRLLLHWCCLASRAKVWRSCSKASRLRDYASLDWKHTDDQLQAPSNRCMFLWKTGRQINLSTEIWRKFGLPSTLLDLLLLHALKDPSVTIGKLPKQKLPGWYS